MRFLVVCRAVTCSTVTYAEKKSLEQRDQAPAEDRDAASSIVEPQRHSLSSYDDTSGLAMLPKVGGNIISPRHKKCAAYWCLASKKVRRKNMKHPAWD